MNKRVTPSEHYERYKRLDAAEYWTLVKLVLKSKGLLLPKLTEADVLTSKEDKNRHMTEAKAKTKTGGRQAGTPNRTTADLRAKLKAVLEAELDQLPKLLEALPLDQRLNIVLKLCPYVLPKAPEDPKPLDSWGEYFS
jgi:hypothetical protein